MQPEINQPTPSDALPESAPAHDDPRDTACREIYLQWLKSCHCRATAIDIADRILALQKTQQHNYRLLRTISLITVSFIGIGGVIGLFVALSRPASPTVVSPLDHLWNIAYPTLIGLATGGISALLFGTATSGLYHHWWEEIAHLDHKIEALRAKYQQMNEEAECHIEHGKQIERTYAKSRGIEIEASA